MNCALNTVLVFFIAPILFRLMITSKLCIISTLLLLILAYQLAEEGYDVWLDNARGNFYSRNHTTLNPNTDAKFWDFSFHEIGLFDLAASIDYVLEHTKVSKLYFVGHSQGCTIMYVLASLRPEYNKKIKAYVHFAPVAFTGGSKSPLFRFYGALEPFLEVHNSNCYFKAQQILQSRY